MSIAIIGSGIGSLTTALLLSKENISIDIYEASDRVGGRLRSLEQGDYRIDAGPTIVLLPEMLLSILEEGGLSLKEIELLPCDPLYDIHFSDGTTFTKYSDLGKQQQELMKTFPEDAASFDRFMTDMEEQYQFGKKMFLERSFSGAKDALRPQILHAFWKLKAYQTVRQRMKKYFTNPKLIDAYSLQTLYVGGNPAQSPALYSLIPYSEHAHGIYYVKGGYARLASILEKELKKRGVRFFTSTRVTNILHDEQQIRGVRVEEEDRLYDTVIYNGDLPAMQDLVSMGNMKKKSRSPKSYVPSSGCFLLYYGLEKTLEAPIHQFFMPDHFLLHMQEVFTNKRLPTDPSFYTFYPSAIDDTLAPKGHSVLYVLVPVPSSDAVDWSRETDAFVEQIEQELERRAFPGFKEAVVWRQIHTPADAKIEGLYEGGSFGIAPMLKQSGMFRPQMKPLPIHGLYAVGASIHPGGGIPIVMQGAKLLADHIKTTDAVRRPLNA
ncbi:phytoene desaturase family protein [Aureibacillus halotolerans]|uniref:Phytoene desaturase n=1 Tax=Aureibacillus halotolerans TaxID=1508390 RepID=A0A4R6UBG1_9BACI|nr:phytoene desaturase family protein [Aureibacillus halotolerans]TDQ42085.1 phytoene desaturase [Aureibacillus halotolerans]